MVAARAPRMPRKASVGRMVKFAGPECFVLLSPSCGSSRSMSMRISVMPTRTSSGAIRPQSVGRTEYVNGIEKIPPPLLSRNDIAKHRLQCADDRRLHDECQRQRLQANVKD